MGITFSKKDRIVRTYSWDELENVPPVDTVIHLARKAHDTNFKRHEKNC